MLYLFKLPTIINSSHINYGLKYITKLYSLNKVYLLGLLYPFALIVKTKRFAITRTGLDPICLTFTSRNTFDPNFKKYWSKIYQTAFLKEHLSKTAKQLPGLEIHFLPNLFTLIYLSDPPSKQKSVKSYNTFERLLWGISLF